MLKLKISFYIILKNLILSFLNSALYSVDYWQCKTHAWSNRLRNGSFCCWEALSGLALPKDIAGKCSSLICCLAQLMPKVSSHSETANVCVWGRKRRGPTVEVKIMWLYSWYTEFQIYTILIRPISLTCIVFVES